VVNGIHSSPQPASAGLGRLNPDSDGNPPRLNCHGPPRSWDSRIHDTTGGSSDPDKKDGHGWMKQQDKDGQSTRTSRR